MKRISILIFLCFAIMSCSSITKYSTQSDFRKYEEKGWNFHLNSQKISISNTYLNNSNFSSFQINKKEKKVFIKQKNIDTNILTINQLILSDSKFSKIDLAVIDGIPYANESFEKVKIEQSIIKEILIMKDTANLLHSPIKNILLIRTK